MSCKLTYKEMQFDSISELNNYILVEKLSAEISNNIPQNLKKLEGTIVHKQLSKLVAPLIDMSEILEKRRSNLSNIRTSSNFGVVIEDIGTQQEINNIQNLMEDC